MSGNISGLRYTYNLEQVENLARYATAAAINHEAAPLNDIVRDYAVFEVGKEGLVWYQENKGHRLQSFKSSFKYSPETYNIFKDAVKTNGFTNTVMDSYRYKQLNNAFRNLPKAPPLPGIVMTQEFKNAKTITHEYKAAKDLIQTSKTLKGKELKTAVKAVEQSIAEAKYGVHTAKQTGIIKPTTAMKKAGHFISKKSGAGYVKGKYLETMAKSSTARTVSKAVKGNAAMVVLSVAMEAPEIMETYQVLGKEKGNKQLVKTAINATAEVAGYVAGMKAGAIAGAAIGSCIPVPIVGTVVGAIVGIGCGLLGSWLAGKAIREFTGPSELDKAREENAKEIAQAAIQDPEIMDDVIDAASKRIVEEQSTDDSKSKDYEAGYSALQEVYTTKQNKELLAQNPQSSTQTSQSSQSTSSERTSTQSGQTASSSSESSSTEENGKKKIKNKSLDKIISNLNQLISPNYCMSQFSSSYSPYQIGFGGYEMNSSLAYNPFMGSTSGMDFANNFNMFPQFSYFS